MCSLNGMVESHHCSLISSSIWCSCNRIILKTTDYLLRGFCTHPFSALTPYLCWWVCFPHFTDNRNEPQSDWTEAQVSKRVNCPGELSRQVAGSRRLRVYPLPTGRCRQTLGLYRQISLCLDEKNLCPLPFQKRSCSPTKSEGVGTGP